MIEIDYFKNSKSKKNR